MTDNKTPYAFPFPLEGFESWRTMTEGHLARMQELQRELATQDDAQYEKARAVVGEGAELMTRSLEMGRRLYTEWRDQSAEALTSATGA